jgi:type I restriction enzyme M protein
MVEIPDGFTYDDIIALKGKRNIGEEIHKIIAAISKANIIKYKI